MRDACAPALRSGSLTPGNHQRVLLRWSDCVLKLHVEQSARAQGTGGKPERRCWSPVGQSCCELLEHGVRGERI